MTQIREVIEVRVPPDEACAYVADLSNAEEWDPGVRRSTAVRGDWPPAVGTEYDLVVALNGKDQPMRYRIEALDPGRHVALHGTGPRLTTDVEFLIEPAGSGSRITYLGEIRLRGLARVVEPFLGGVIAATGRRAITGMKDVFDAKTA